MPATTPAHAPLNKPHEAVAPVVAMTTEQVIVIDDEEGVAPVVANATEEVIVIDDEEGVAPVQHATIDAHANLSSSM